MTVKEYTIVKENPLFVCKVGDVFTKRGTACWLKHAKSHNNMRCKCYDNLDLDMFVASGLATVTTKEVADPTYKEGDLVVYNIAGTGVITAQKQSHKNMICRINDVKYRGKTIYYSLKNIYTNEIVGEVKESVIPYSTSMYWFIDSHGTVKQTYFWLRPYEDAYRIASKNIFNSYEEAEKHLNEVTKKINYAELPSLISEYVNR